MATTPQTPQQQKEEQERKAKEQAQKAEQQRKEREQKEGKQAAGSVVSAGAASTYNMAGGTPANMPLADPRGDRFFTRDEITNLAGDIVPGEIAWLKLDENGTPQGGLVRDYPVAEGVLEGETFARVVGASTHKYDEITTPSGAPVTKFMNPDPVLWDEGMLLRNPPPEPTERDKEFKTPAGAPVVNQPVTA